MSYFSVYIPFLSLSLNILAQIFSYKYLLKARLLKSEYFGFVCGGLFLIVLELIVFQSQKQESFSLFFVDMIIYSCFSYGYFNFINMGETARRIRLLRELYEACDGLTKEQILKVYNSGNIISQRLDRLLNNHQIVLRDGRYYAGKPLVLFISKAIVFVKLLVFGRASEFDEKEK